MGAPARDMALATIATAVARTDPTWAGGSRSPSPASGQAPGQDRSEREQPPPPSMLAEPDQAMYWKVRALTEVAIAAATAEADRPARPPEDAERFARSITTPGTMRDVAPTTAETAAAQIDPEQAGQLLTEAEQWARAISKSDLQAKALTSVQSGGGPDRPRPR